MWVLKLCLARVVKAVNIVYRSIFPRRTLSVLFAIANGVPIVTEDWVNLCVTKAKWVHVAGIGQVATPLATPRLVD